MKDRPHPSQESREGKSVPDRKKRQMTEGERATQPPVFIYTRLDPLPGIVNDAEAKAAHEFDAETFDETSQGSLEEIRRESESIALGEVLREELQEEGSRYDQMFLEVIESTREERLQEELIRHIEYIDNRGELLLPPTKRFHLLGKDRALKKTREKHLASVRERRIVEGNSPNGKFSLLYRLKEIDSGREIYVPTSYSDDVVGISYRDGVVAKLSISVTPEREQLCSENAPEIMRFMQEYTIQDNDFHPGEIIFALGDTDTPPHIMLNELHSDDSLTFTVSDYPREDEATITPEGFRALFLEGLTLVPHQPGDE